MFRVMVLCIAAVAVGLGCSAQTEKTGIRLSRKAEVFDYDMRTRFLLDGQALCKRRVPTAGTPYPTYNMPDNAYMTGMYLGTLSMKYAVTKDPQVRAQAGESIQALHLLCTVTGKPGLLARSAVPLDEPFQDDGTWRTSADGRYRWRGDVSSDQMDGVLFGFAMAYDLVANDEEKRLIAADAAALVDHILDNNLRIVGYDGKPTTWGSYYPSYVQEREPMNAVLLLQHLKVAAHVTGEDRLAEAYRQIAVDRNYARIAVNARRMLDPTIPGRINHSDDVLLFLAYYPLLRLEQDPQLRALYLESLKRAWEGADGQPGVKPEANPFYAFTAHAFLDDASGDAAAILTLAWFPFDMKWNRDTIAQYEQRFGFTSVSASGSLPPAKGEPIPIDRRVKTWSAWVQDPYHHGGDRSTDTATEYNGHDYLLGYWLGRYHDYVDEAM